MIIPFGLQEYDKLCDICDKNKVFGSIYPYPTAFVVDTFKLSCEFQCVRSDLETRDTTKLPIYTCKECYSVVMGKPYPEDEN